MMESPYYLTHKYPPQKDAANRHILKGPYCYNSIKKHLLSYLLIMAIIVFSAILLFGLMQQSLKITEYNITSTALPIEFDGYRIAHISDFHSGLFSGSASDIIKAVSEQSPNIICLTGDMVDSTTVDDSTTCDFSSVEDLISGLSSIAPVYAVSGNNEHYDPSINETMEYVYRKYGVHIMDGKTMTIYNEGAALTMSGIADRRKRNILLSREALALKQNHVKEGFGILLYHRANEYDALAEAGYDLVLSGHTHGGIIRLPLIGGVLAPDGDLFPRYSGGLYEVNGAWLVSNKGVADNNLIPRIYNPPEIVSITLHAGA